MECLGLLACYLCRYYGTIAALIPPDRLKQPDALIVAQGINRDPRSFCDLLDR